ncbi:MAG TPA: putative LPS assembly protein LptD, partial [Segetibacter sp.]
MSNLCKVRAKCISCGIAIFILSILTFYSSAKYHKDFFTDSFTNNADTVPVKKKVPTVKKSVTTLRADTTRRPATSLRSDTTKKPLTITDTTRKRDSIAVVQKIDTIDFKVSKDALDAPIEYAAQDSGVLTIPTKQFILYGKANTKYSDIELNAATIKLEQEKQLVTAYGDKDSTGSPYDKPKLVQGETSSLSDTIYYNLRSQKGLTKSTYLREGEMYVFANTVKKVSNDILYAWRGRFTTCNLDTPHFAFRTRKMKIVNNKIAVSGPAFPEFEGVPIPVGIPFGIYPLKRGQQSGILPPQFAANEDFGLGLEGLGYYKVLNEYVDLTVRSNIYSYGGWNLNTSSRYTRRYRFDGGLNLSLQNTKILNRSGTTKDEFTKNSSFMVGWNHSINSKARPGTNFSANVNAGSTKFNRFVPNNTNLNFQNQLTSSINYSKDWGGKYNLSVSANHSQNNLQRLITLNLPTINFSAVTVYPFQRREQIGQSKWWEKLGIGYTGNVQNNTSFYDSAFNLRKLLDTAQWAATHNIPITLSLPSLGPIQISPGISYSERWFGQAMQPYWDPAAKMVGTRMTRGFYTERQSSLSLSANTRVFGTYLFNRPTGLQAIRHEIRPSISASYTPDLNKGNIRRVQVDSMGTTFLPFSTITGSFINGDRTFGGISFGIDNTL